MSVLTLGESMGVVASPSTFASAPTATIDFCGAESNVAIGLARLGVGVTWASRLGNDAFGALIRQSLLGEGVRVVAESDADRHTGLLLKERRTATVTRVTYRRAHSAAAALGVADVDALPLDGIRLVHLTGITPALSGSALDAIRRLVERSRAHGALLSFDINHRSKLWGATEAAGTLRPLISASDLVFASPPEAQLFVGSRSHPTELARAVADLGPAEVVLTRGPEGAVAVRGEEEHSVEARPIPVVDTMGAGDAFVAGYLAELLEGASIEQRLRTATTAAAFACQSTSDWAGAPTRQELSLFDADDPISR